jgi:hypothetical protein
MVIEVDAEVQALITDCDDEFALRVNEGIRMYIKELEALLSETHAWQFTPTENLFSVIEDKARAEDVAGINEVVWKDLFESIDASRHFFMKRSQPLLESSVSLLNAGNLISSAPIARSLFELSIWALQHSGTFNNTLKEYPPQANPTTHVMDATGLQELVFKLIWGTRLKERTDRGKEFSQMHIIDQFKKVAQRDEQKYIEPMYDFLCELCHPNAVGNWLFGDTDGIDNAKSQVEIMISSKQCGGEQKKTTAHLCGSICWSSMALADANKQYDQALLWIDNRMGLKKFRH